MLERQTSLSREAFCQLLTKRLAHGFDRLQIRPGQHVVDDLGFDSLLVVEYAVALEELGCEFELHALDRMLDVDEAFDRCAALQGWT